MTTDALHKLVCGTRSLDLTSGNYEVDLDWRPPAAEYSMIVAQGSSANIYGGGRVAYRKFNNRTFSFRVKVKGSSDAEINQAIRVLDDFLRLAKDNSDPLYYLYKANTDVPTPLWGQSGAPYQYEIVDGRVRETWDSYGTSTFRARTVFVTLELNIKPFALGQAQQVCTATGGVYEDTIGAADGRSRGLGVPEATTNLFTNPVFGNSTWNSGWNNGTCLIANKNTDSRWLLPGTINSAKLDSIGTTTGINFTQDLTLGASPYILSALVALPDACPVTSTQMQMAYNGSALSTSYLSACNGLWYAAACVVGTGGSASTGVIVKTPYRVYLMEAQAERKDYRTPLCWGDLMGCAWSASAHASSSTRTVASCKLPVTATTFTPNAFSVQVIWRAARPSTAYASNCQMIYEATTAARLAVIAATGQFAFNDGTNSASGVATAFAAGEIIVMLVTCGPNGIALYRNGVADGAGNNSYARTLTATNWYIGSNLTPAAHTDGTFLDVTFFDRVLTAAEVANEYANVAQAIARGGRFGSIPWLWTNSGDNILSLDTGKQPLGVAGGIPGSAPALTEIRGDTSGLTTIKGILLSCFDTAVPLKFADLFTDSSGTVLAGDYGGQHKNTTITSPSSPILDGLTPRASAAKELNGKEAYVVARLKAGAATAFYFKTSMTLSGTNVAFSDNRVITPSTSYRLFRTNKIVLNTYNNQYSDLSPYILYCSGASGEQITIAVSIDGDWAALVPRNVLVIATSDAGGLSTKFGLQGLKAYDLGYAANDWVGSQLPCTGDPIEFMAGRYNILQCYVGAEESVDPLTTYTVTLTTIKITPRYALL